MDTSQRRAHYAQRPFVRFMYPFALFMYTSVLSWACKSLCTTYTRVIDLPFTYRCIYKEFASNARAKRAGRTLQRLERLSRMPYQPGALRWLQHNLEKGFCRLVLSARPLVRSCVWDLGPAQLHSVKDCLLLRAPYVCGRKSSRIEETPTSRRRLHMKFGHLKGGQRLSENLGAHP